MASQQKTADYILEQVADAGTVSARKMFGEFGLYCDGKIVALICDDNLFVKPTQEGKEFIGEFVEGIPYKGAKSWLLISGEVWEDSECLSELIRITAQMLPAAKPKKPKPKKPSVTKKHNARKRI